MNEDFRALAYRISDFANRNSTRLDFLKELAKHLLDFARCDEVEMWLLDPDSQKKCEVVRRIHRPEASFHFAVRDLGPDERTGTPVSEWEQLCRDVLEERLDPASPSGREKIGGSEGSAVLVPLRSGHRMIGLMRLQDRRSNHFTPAETALFENLAQPLGISVVNQRAQAALRERVKELTCMYAIAQAAAPGVTVDEIMRRTVELLPPAWQYPACARGRIVWDGRVYETPGTKSGPHRLGADIVAAGVRRGSIEVIYTREVPAGDDGPFLTEERNLIDNIAKALSLVVEQKEAEEDKARLREQVRRADRLATIGQLAAGVAHELNEPLGAILGYAQLMDRQPGIVEAQKRDIGRMIHASLHAREIVKKLLLFARQVPTRKTQVDVNQIVNEGLSFLESRCAQEGITVVRSLEERLPPVVADPSQLTQVLVNLIVNAVQAMKNGGTLTVRTGERRGRVILAIEDTGEGMAKEVVERIFLPFFTTKEVGQGTGLGLAVAHGIVSAHGGSIRVDSGVGRGSRFEIELPGAGPAE